MEELRRYTSLPATLAMLRSKSITLLPPDSWDDLNDKRLLEAYKAGSNLKSVLCLCFAEAAETYHHWKVFASGSDGLCIVFNKQRLLQDLSKAKVRVLARKVDYLSIGNLRTNAPSLADLPFSKRVAYQPEEEFRLLWESTTEKASTKNFMFSREAIDRIVINPWLHSSLVQAVKETILLIPDFSNLEIKQSKITDGPAWKRLAEKYA